MLLLHMPRGPSAVAVTGTLSRTPWRSLDQAPRSSLAPRPTRACTSLLDYSEEERMVPMCVFFLIAKQLDHSALWYKIWYSQTLLNQYSFSYLLEAAHCDEMTEKT